MSEIFDPAIGQKRNTDSGQFAGKDFEDATGGLQAIAPTRARAGANADLRMTPALAARQRALIEGGMVPAVAFPTSNEHMSTAETSREQWWNSNFAAAEYGRSVPKMPDDYTPGMTSGRAMSEHRRTHRMKYRGDQIELRMPSATAIRRYSAENGNGTFDVPISANTDTGPVTGWVRVTRTGPSTWSAQAMGFTGDNEAKVAEAVASVLEARRKVDALTDIGDLVTRHNERRAAAGAALESVDSTFMSGVGYDESSSTMITQIGRRVYGHAVPPEVYARVKGSTAPGGVFNALVKGQQRVELKRCTQCRRFMAAGSDHVCPANVVKRGEFDRKAAASGSRAARRRAANAIGWANRLFGGGK